ncbi:lipoprotein NlpI [Vibrio cholerae]|uniref:lipoprotein NlpI n=1 Tax=Vibrio cholerae TaxID=666 RepID=UPI0006E6A95E|nr:lipoprotein NlpI [Vibrio cholerae]KQA13379.1 lipoprotein NlpI [Vibrio cholerae]KQA82420.1 lipoprotein NlpI [Vibrio cholerae]KQA87844.1 lipoprotein NlpI [Vibrio cholerae]MBO1391212.1 lipoprotein NlpI [Vibrio cholerae]PAR78122.1 lipoprotein NlpI [Vibrio cholerae]
MKWFRFPIAVIGLVLLSGCATQNESATQWLYPPMAVPLQASIQQEVQIARLSQLLQRTDLEPEIRAKMLFERGNYYDSVGLRDLARLDFTQSLSINPAQPDVFNLLGVYYTEAGEFDAAYESFDSTLELDPSNEYAVRNRAIALYYGERPQLALEEITKHYQQDPQDPFRALWLYIIESDIDPTKARTQLLERYQQHDEQWGWVLVGLMLDQLSEEVAFKAIIAGSRENELLAQRLTEAYFYLGKRYQMQGELAHALSLYKLAISFNVYEYVEHRYAFLELGRIYQQAREEQLARAKAEAMTQ